MVDKTFTLGIKLTRTQYKALEQQARQRGYEDTAAYLLALAERDFDEEEIDEGIRRIINEYTPPTE